MEKIFEMDRAHIGRTNDVVVYDGIHDHFRCGTGFLRL